MATRLFVALVLAAVLIGIANVASAQTATPASTPTPNVPSRNYVLPRPDYSLGFYELPITIAQTVTGVKNKVTAGWGHKSINYKLSAGTATVDINCQSSVNGSIKKLATAAAASDTIMTDMWCDALWCDVLTCSGCNVTCIVNAWR